VARSASATILVHLTRRHPSGPVVSTNAFRWAMPWPDTDA